MKQLSKIEKKKLDSFSTMSAKIRFLNDKGWTKSEIKNELKIIYQWVRNVLNQNIKTPKENHKI